MKTVFVNGTFDVLHRGHLMLLNYAKSFGDYLIVGIDADSRVKEKKGKSRPVNTSRDREFMLLNLKSVDDVKIFGTDEELKNLVKSINPDIMIVGSDWKNKTVIGSCYCKELIFFDRINEYSSTKIIQSIIDRR